MRGSGRGRSARAVPHTLTASQGGGAMTEPAPREAQGRGRGGMTKPTPAQTQGKNNGVSSEPTPAQSQGRGRGRSGATQPPATHLFPHGIGAPATQPLLTQPPATRIYAHGVIIPATQPPATCLYAHGVLALTTQPQLPSTQPPATRIYDHVFMPQPPPPPPPPPPQSRPSFSTPQTYQGIRPEPYMWRGQQVVTQQSLQAVSSAKRYMNLLKATDKAAKKDNLASASSTDRDRN